MAKADKHDHPDINTNDYYLALVHGNLHFGKFTKQWYGLNFACGLPGSGIQFDAPGMYASSWKRLWRLEPDTETGHIMVAHMLQQEERWAKEEEEDFDSDEIGLD